MVPLSEMINKVEKNTEAKRGRCVCVALLNKNAF